MNHLLVVLFVLVAAPASYAQIEALVENGATVPASCDLSRSVAALRLSDGSGCSASFLDQSTLLTAGHCTSGSKAAGTWVQVRDARGKWWQAEAKSLITHPMYLLGDGNGDVQVRYDLGIVKLKQAFPIKVRPLEISTVDGLQNAEVDVTVVGYGRSNGWSASFGTLRRGVMTARFLPVEFFFGRKGLLMHPKRNQVVCSGDSGGAVLRGSSTSTKLIGVHSISNGCKGSDEPMSISEAPIQQLNWIKSVWKK